MNASFGVEDGLQLLQTVADSSRYESTCICEACSELIMNELSNALDKARNRLRPG